MANIKTFTVKTMLGGRYLTSQPKVECTVEITVDLDQIVHELGNKAFSNKSKRANEAHGAIKVVVRPTLNAQSLLAKKDA